MRKKAVGWTLAAFVCIATSACGGGKQEAAVALDEARLSVSGARKVGAQLFAPVRLGDAAALLAAAEDSFKKGKFDRARNSAQGARDAARLAENEARDAARLADKGAKSAQASPRKRKARARN